MSKLPVEMKIHLSEEMAEKLARRAYEQNVSVGTLIREALSEFLNEKRPVRGPVAQTSEKEVEDVRSQFVEAVERSSNWNELQEQLRAKGLDIAPKGGGLVVRRAGTNTDLCKASDIGFAYSRLIRRYRAGWPDHPHAWLAERILSNG